MSVSLSPAIRLGLLFAGSFVVSLAYLKRPGLDAMHAWVAPGRPVVDVPAVAAAHVAGSSSKAPQPDTQAAPEELPKSPAKSQRTEQQEQQLVSDAVNAEEGDDRGNAVRALGEDLTPASLATLAQVLRSDPDLRNRILAVRALEQGSSNASSALRSEVRLLLLDFVHDPQEPVAELARSVVDRIAAS
jgi:hypothetical protein